MAESMPTSVSAFTHRRARADSTASFAFYNDEEPDESPMIDDEDEEARGRGDVGDLRFGEETADEDDSTDISTDLERQAADNDYVLHRRASTQSRGSVRSRLLRRDSGLSGGSEFGRARFSQKTYMVNEDLYIVIAGFRTSLVGMTIYVLLCILTFGLAWLLFRWVPRWHVKLIGKPSTLRDSEWVVIEVGYGTSDNESLQKLTSVRTHGMKWPYWMSAPSRMADQSPPYSVLQTKSRRICSTKTRTQFLETCELSTTATSGSTTTRSGISSFCVTDGKTRPGQMFEQSALESTVTRRAIASSSLAATSLTSNKSPLSDSLLMKYALCPPCKAVPD